MPCRLRRIPPLLLSVCLLTIGTAALHALDPDRRITQYDIRLYQAEHGLPMNSLTTVFQDRRGFLWIGCQAGLVRFDGVAFMVYSTARYPGLPDNFVTAIAEDPAGNLWIATHGGVSRFDGSRFTPFPIEGETGDRITAAVLVDRTGAVWASGTFGLGRFDGERFRTFPIPGHRLRSTVAPLVEAGDGTILLGGPAPGLFRWRNGRVERVPGITSLVTALYRRRSGDVVIGTGTGDLFHYRSGRLRPFAPARSPLAHAVKDILEDRDGNWWFASDGGITRYARERFDTHTVARGLPGDNNFVMTVIEDREGNLWFQSEGGLYEFSDNRCLVFGGTEGFLNNNGQAVIQTPDGAMWAGFREGGAARFTGTATELLGRSEGLRSMNIRTLVPAADGGLWLGSETELYRYRDGDLRLWSPAEGLPNRNIRVLYEDREGVLWIGSLDGLLTRFDGDRFRPFRIGDGYPAGVHAIAATADGALLIGTVRRGMYRVDGDSLRSWAPHPDLATGGITAFHVDGDSVLWVGTDGRGLYRCTADSVSQYTARQGLSFDRLYSIVDDDRGGMWFHGNQGIFTIPRTDLVAFANGRSDTLICRHFTHLDGMRESECNGRRQPSAWKSRDGRLWFACISGIVSIDPAGLAPSPVAPPVYIETVVANADATHPIRVTHDALDLTAWQRVLEFHFTAPHFTVPERVRFRYRLDGSDADWVEAGKRRFATYTNLGPGEYRFRVMASNHDGVWNDQEAMLRVAIPPFWWESWPARIGYGILGLLAIGGLVRIRTRYVLQRTRLAMKAEHATRLEELDRMKTHFFANISHEFRTPLTLILGPLEEFLEGRYPANPEREYRIMYRNARRLLALINQMLDLARLDAGGMTLTTRRVDLVVQVRTIASAFLSHADRQRVRLVLELPEAALPAWVDVDKLEKILTNLLGNAFKYSPAGSTVTVSLERLADPDSRAGEGRAVIAVADSGPGIQPDQLAHIFDRFYRGEHSHRRSEQSSGIGLALVRELVTLHHGDIDAESEPGRGSRFIITLPLGDAHLAPEEKGHAATPSTDASAGERGAAVTDVTEPPPDPATPGDRNLPVTPRDADAHVLIVEDNADLRHYLREHLEPAFRVSEAGDGMAGLDAARDMLPDLIISDVMMPEMDGMELCQTLKGDPLTSHIPVILLTALANTTSRLEGLETRADDYLVKPFNAAELVARSRNLITLRRQLRDRYRRESGLTPGEVTVTRHDATLLEHATAIMEREMDNGGYTVDAFAADLGWSPATLKRKLKALTGLAPREFMYDRRIRRASVLLRESDHSVTEICYETGFANPGHMARLFRKRFGMSPTAYRRQGR